MWHAKKQLKTMDENLDVENRTIRERNHHLIEEFFTRTSQIIDTGLMELSRLVQESMFNAVCTYTKSMVKEKNHLLRCDTKRNVSKIVVEESKESQFKTPLSENVDESSDIEIIEVREPLSLSALKTTELMHEKSQSVLKTEPEEVKNESQEAKSPESMSQRLPAVKRIGYVRIN